MRLNRIEKFKLEKKQKRNLLICFFIIIPVISVLLGYIITQVFITPMLVGK